MKAFIGFIASWLIISLLCGLIVSCEHSVKEEQHNRLTEGCRMIGTIQGYRVGRDSMPAQEQWDCGGIMRTVNAVDY